jgi:uncharacterized short protein YbdD (DUF466 family)
MSSTMTRMRTSLERIGALLRRVIGAPDYERYLAHVRLAHPGMTPLTRGQFVNDAMARRYGKGAGRCC